MNFQDDDDEEEGCKTPTPGSQATKRDLAELTRVFNYHFVNRASQILLTYSATGDINVLLNSLKMGAYARNENKDTILHAAVKRDQEKVISQILQVLSRHSELLNAVNDDHQTALHIAVMKNCVGIIQKLLSANADPLILDPRGNTSFHVACSRGGNVEVLRYLLASQQSRDVDLEVTNRKGQTCFHMASASDNVDCIRALFRSGFDCNAYDCEGRTPLHVASELNNVIAVECLLNECTANINCTTYTGLTPLHIAAQNNFVELAEILLLCGADVGLKTANDEDGMTPLDVAQTQQMRDVLNIAPPTTQQLIITHTSIPEAEDLCLLDPVVRTELCSLLNSTATSNNWYKLATELHLEDMAKLFRDDSNPTDCIIDSYICEEGTVGGLLSALVSMGRSDAVQLLERNATCSKSATPTSSTSDSRTAVTA